jgi:hypothetical protein
LPYFGIPLFDVYYAISDRVNVIGDKSQNPVSRSASDHELSPATPKRIFIEMPHVLLSLMCSAITEPALQYHTLVAGT